MGSNIRFMNKGKTGEIWLYDSVGAGWFGGMSANDFVKELKNLGKVDTINLHINSPGGAVFDGVAIYNALKGHPARVEVDVDGVAASIASVIAMAGHEIRIADNAMMMIHDPYTMAAGDAAELRKSADLLDQIALVIRSTYAKRTGQDEAQIGAMMAAETWMTASEAFEQGFADAVTAEQRAAASMNFDFSAFRHAPKNIGTSAARSIGNVKLVAMSSRIAGQTSR